jgi:hypothetical protein
MFQFFDSVYYKCCALYAKEGTDVGVSGLALLAMMQLFNIMTIDFIISIQLKKDSLLGKVSIIIVYIVLLVLDGLRYNKLPNTMLKERWDGESESKKAKTQLLVLLYVTVSTISCVGLAIYIGSNRS